MGPDLGRYRRPRIGSQSYVHGYGTCRAEQRTHWLLAHSHVLPALDLWSSSPPTYATLSGALRPAEFVLPEVAR
jgi:hypothetical protein